MELALLFVIAAVIGGGVSGALLTTWSVHRRIRSLEYLMIDQERVLTREVKRRAAGDRWTKPDMEAEALAKQFTAVKVPKFDNEF